MKRLALLGAAGTVDAAQSTRSSVGPGHGVSLQKPEDRYCFGQFLLNYDGSAENGYCWQYGGVVPPYFQSQDSWRITSPLPLMGLAPDTYRLRIEPVIPGTVSWLAQWYDRAPSPKSATPITIGAAGRVVPITLNLVQGVRSGERSSFRRRVLPISPWSS